VPWGLKAEVLVDLGEDDTGIRRALNELLSCSEPRRPILHRPLRAERGHVSRLPWCDLKQLQAAQGVHGGLKMPIADDVLTEVVGADGAVDAARRTGLRSGSQEIAQQSFERLAEAGPRNSSALV
jgi:hypothetical protein